MTRGRQIDSAHAIFCRPKVVYGHVDLAPVHYDTTKVIHITVQDMCHANSFVAGINDILN